MNSQIYKLPSEFLSRLKKITGPAYPRVCRTFLARKAPSFRINYIKTDIRSLREALHRERIRYKELSWPVGAFFLKSTLRQLQDTCIYREGDIYVQNISSMIPVEMLKPQAEEAILDMCAAPGAKTTQIASMTRGRCQITAIEKIRTRYYKLLANVKYQQAFSVSPLLYDGIWVRKKFPEQFDRVLLDAPCSAEGRFCLTNPRSYKYWKLQKVKEMAHKQKKLAVSAVRALKPGGILVYSTCTFSPEENEEVIDWILNKYSDALTMIPCEVPLPDVERPLKGWKGKKFSSDICYARRILPDEHREGFFVAKLKKL